ncbi:MAG: hypothetical protein ACYDDF_05645 [Thermoplasmatota archaeon]
MSRIGLSAFAIGALMVTTGVYTAMATGVPALPPASGSQTGPDTPTLAVYFYRGDTWTPAGCTGTTNLSITFAYSKVSASLPTGPFSCVAVAVSGGPAPVNASAGIPADSTGTVTLTNGYFVPSPSAGTTDPAGTCVAPSNADPERETISASAPSGANTGVPTLAWVPTCATVLVTPLTGPSVQVSAGLPAPVSTATASLILGGTYTAGAGNSPVGGSCADGNTIGTVTVPVPGIPSAAANPNPATTCAEIALTPPSPMSPLQAAVSVPPQAAVSVAFYSTGTTYIPPSGGNSLGACDGNAVASYSLDTVNGPTSAGQPVTPVTCVALTIQPPAGSAQTVAIGEIATASVSLVAGGTYAPAPGNSPVGAACNDGTTEASVEAPLPGVPSVTPTPSPETTCAQIAITPPAGPSVGAAVSVPPEATVSASFYSTGATYAPPTANGPTTGSCIGTPVATFSLDTQSGPEQNGFPVSPITCVSVTIQPPVGAPQTIAIGALSTATATLSVGGTYTAGPGNMPVEGTCQGGTQVASLTAPLPGTPSIEPGASSSPSCAEISFNGPAGPMSAALPVPPQATASVSFYTTGSTYTPPAATPTPTTGSCSGVASSTETLDANGPSPIPPSVSLPLTCVSLTVQPPVGPSVSAALGAVATATASIIADGSYTPGEGNSPIGGSCSPGTTIASVQEPIPGVPSVATNPPAQPSCAQVAITPPTGPAIQAAIAVPPQSTVTVNFYGGDSTYTAPDVNGPTTGSCSGSPTAVVSLDTTNGPTVQPPAGVVTCVTLTVQPPVGSAQSVAVGALAQASAEIFAGGTYAPAPGNSPLGASCNGGTMVASITAPVPGVPGTTTNPLANTACAEIAITPPVGPPVQAAMNIPPEAAVTVNFYGSDSTYTPPNPTGPRFGSCSSTAVASESLDTKTGPQESVPTTPITCISLTVQPPAGTSQSFAVGAIASASAQLVAGGTYTAGSGNSPLGASCTNGQTIAAVDAPIPGVPGASPNSLQGAACAEVSITPPGGSPVQVATSVPPQATVTVNFFGPDSIFTPPSAMPPSTGSCSGTPVASESLDTSGAANPEIPTTPVSCASIVVQPPAGPSQTVAVGALAVASAELVSGGAYNPGAGNSPVGATCTGDPVASVLAPIPGVPGPAPGTVGVPTCAEISFTPAGGATQTIAVPLPPGANVGLSVYGAGASYTNPTPPSPATGTCNGPATMDGAFSPTAQPNVNGLPSAPVTCISLTVQGPAGNAETLALGVPRIGSSLTITQEPPVQVSAGLPFGMNVTVVDAYGEPAISPSTPVTATVVTGAGSLGGQDVAMTGHTPADMSTAAFTALVLTKAGRYTLAATSPNLGDASPSSSVLVVPAAPKSIAVTPSPASMAAGGTIAFQAIETDAYGNAIAFTPTWSTDCAGDSISAGGLFSGQAANPGCTVTAADASFPIAGFASLVITPAAPHAIAVSPDSLTMIAGGSQQFGATETDQYGNVISFTPTWTTTCANDAIDASGLFTGTNAQSSCSVVAADEGHGVSSSSSVVVKPAAPETVTVSPSSVTIAAGASQTFTATEYDHYNNAISFTPAWTTTCTNDAIGLNGDFSGTVANAGCSVTATDSANNLAGMASVVVDAAAPSKVTIDPPSGNIVAGSSQQFTATETDPYGNTISFTPTWTTTCPGNDAVSPTGLFTGFTASTACTVQVSDRANALSSTADVVVRPAAPSSVTVSPSNAMVTAGGSLSFSAVEEDQYHNVIAFTPTWTTTCAGDSITSAGVFSGTVANQGCIVTATDSASQVTGTANATVQHGSANAVTIDPNQATMTAGGSQQFTVTETDQYGNAISFTPTWTTTCPGTDTVSSTGLLTGVTASPGCSVQVSDSANSLSSTAAVIVNPAPASSVTVSPSNATVTAGGSQPFSAVEEDQYHNVIAFTPTWTTTCAGDSITSAAVFSGTVANAGCIVTATDSASQVAGTANVVVQPAQANTLTVNPNQVTMVAGGSQHFTATETDQYGNAIAFAPVWATTCGGSDTVSQSGNLTGHTANATCAVSAADASSGLENHASVTVEPAAPSTITIDPSNATVAAGQSQQYAATVKDTYGNTIAASTAWSTDCGGSDSISSAGLFSGTTPNSACSVTGVSDGLTGHAALTVTPAALANIAVSPASASITAGGSQQFSATGTDQYGNPVSFTPSWTTTCANDTVSTSGLFSGDMANAACKVTASGESISKSASMVVSPGPAVMLAWTNVGNDGVETAGSPFSMTLAIEDQYGNVVPNVTATVILTTTADQATMPSPNPSSFTNPNAGTRTFSFTIDTAGSQDVLATTSRTSGTHLSSADAPLTVNPAALAAIAVSPTSASMTAGGSQTFVANGTDRFGNSVSFTPDWTTTCTSDGISPGGVFSGTAANSGCNVAASSGSIQGTATMVVTAAGLAVVTVSPASATVTAGGTETFHATGADAYGNPVSIVPTWTTDCSNATIDSSAGTFASQTADVSCGVMATSGTVDGSSRVSVQPAALQSIVVTPNAPRIVAGAGETFVATGYDHYANVVTIVPTWATGCAHATITSNGVFASTTSDSSCTVTATVSSVVGTANVTVGPDALYAITVSPDSVSIVAGVGQSFTASGADRYGNSVTFTPLWATSCAQASINGAGSLASTTADAGCNVTAAANGVTGVASVTVLPAALASIGVAPANPTLTAGVAQTFTATGYDQYRNVVAMTPAWATDCAGATIATSGLFNSNTADTSCTVTATNGTVHGTSTVVVEPAALYAIMVDPAAPTITAGSPQGFSASGVDRYGNTVGFTASWATTCRSATIAANGSFATTTADASCNVTATASGVTGVANVTVTPSALASIAVSPSAPTLTAGVAQNFTAIGYDRYGNTVSFTPTWATNCTRASIVSTGAFASNTADAACHVNATGESVVGTAGVVVGPAALSSIAVSPATVTLTAGVGKDFGAVGYDRYANVVSFTPVWATDCTNATVNMTGAFASTVADGSCHATATNGSVVGTAAIVVQPAALFVIVVTPRSVSIVAGVAQPFGAVGDDQYGNAVSITPLWTTNCTSATIDSSGGFSSITADRGCHVTATNGTVNGTASVAVVPAALNAISLSPASPTIVAGVGQAFSTTGVDRYGNLVAFAPTWATTCGGAVVNATGYFASTTADARCNVTAQANTVVGTANVTVTPAALAVIDVSPSTTTITAGVGRNFTAVGYDQFNNTVVFTPGWSTNCTAATIDANGSFASTRADSACRVSATNGSVIGNGTVSVVPAALHVISLSPASATIAAGSSKQFAASGADQYGNAVPIAPTWNTTCTSDSVTSGGFFSGHAANNGCVVRATQGAVVGSASVVVTPGTVTQLLIALPGQEVLMNGISAVTINGTPTPFVAGRAFNATIVAVDQYDNLATGYIGAKQIAINGPGGVNLTGYDGSGPGATDASNATIAFGAPATMTFTGGEATTWVTIFRATPSITLTAADTVAGGATPSSSFAIDPAAAHALGILTCDPATITNNETDRASCVLESGQVSKGLTTTHGTKVTLYAGDFDSHDNLILNNDAVTWSGTGVASNVSGSGVIGIIWQPKTAGTGTIAVAENGLVTGTMSVTVN